MTESVMLEMLDGSSQGRLKLTFTDWQVTPYKLPYEMINECQDLPGIDGPGLYFLFGRDGVYPRLYLGAARYIYHELPDHVMENTVFAWDQAVVFPLGGRSDLGQTELQNLAFYFYSGVKAAGSYVLWNDFVPRYDNAADLRAVGLTYGKIKEALELLGFDLFQARQKYEDWAEQRVKSELFYIGCGEASRLNADCRFTLVMGSCLAPLTDDSSERIAALRKKMQKAGKLKDLATTRDLTFRDELAMLSGLRAGQWDFHSHPVPLVRCRDDRGLLICFDGYARSVNHERDLYHPECLGAISLLLLPGNHWLERGQGLGQRQLDLRIFVSS